MLKQCSQPDPSKQSFVPIVTILRDLDDLAREFKFKLDDGEDDLDDYQVACLETTRGSRFLLVKYRHSPRGQVELYIPPRMPNHGRVIEEIIDALHVPPSETMRREGDYDSLR